MSIEILFLAALADVVILMIIALVFRGTGKRFPEWVAGKRVAKWINSIIDPDPKRLDRLLGIAGMSR